MNLVNNKQLIFVITLLFGLHTISGASEGIVSVNITTEVTVVDRAEQLRNLSQAVEERNLEAVKKMAPVINLEPAEIDELLKIAYNSVDTCGKNLEKRSVKNIPSNLVNIGAWSLLTFFLSKHIIAEAYANQPYALAESPIGLPFRILCLAGCLGKISYNISDCFSNDTRFIELTKACRIQKIFHDLNQKIKTANAA